MTRRTRPPIVRPGSVIVEIECGRIGRGSEARNVEQNGTVSRGSVVGVIPARYESTRLPGKVLADLGGRTILSRVYARAVMAGELSKVLIAVDDERVLREALALGATAVMTRRDHRSGTDRVAEAIGTIADECDFAVNIQGDEPFLDSTIIDELARAVRADPQSIWTAVSPLRDAEALNRADVVKAVLGAGDRVIYFSRAPVPHVRGSSAPGSLHWHHVGIYAQARGMLDRFVSMRPSPLERAEGLEQLRAIEAGIPVRAIRVDSGFGGVDTAEDLERAKAWLAAQPPEGRDE